VKKVVKKILSPIYKRIYDRFVETILSELRQNDAVLSEKLLEAQKSIKNGLSQELQQHTSQIFNEIAWRNDAALHRADHLTQELQQQTSQIFHEIGWRNDAVLHRVEHLLREIRLYQEVATVNSVAFSEYKNKFIGRDVVIVGTGPTLDKYTKPIENAIHIGLNKAYKSDVKLDFLFVTDSGYTKNKLAYLGKEDIENYNCKKFFGLTPEKDYGFFSPTESFCAKANATRFFHVGSNSDDLIYPNICVNPTVSYGTVAIPALHFALFTAPKRIFLVGLDVDKVGHFSKSGEPDLTGVSLEVMINTVKIPCGGYRRMKEFAKHFYPDTEIISINPVGLAGLYEDYITDEHGELVKENNCSENVGLWKLDENEIRDYLEQTSAIYRNLADKNGG